MAAGALESMQKAGMAAQELDKWRRIHARDPVASRLAREISEDRHRMICVMHLVSVALARPKRRMGLLDHIRAWWRER